SLCPTTTPPTRSTFFPTTTLFRPEPRRIGPIVRRAQRRRARSAADVGRQLRRAVVFVSGIHEGRDDATNTTARRNWRPTSAALRDRKSTRLNSSHSQISYAVFCLK